uniref:Uncharacterized protein n=1 Tax=Heliothis virescens TaxID=7102 RepID=A0A2A4K003_HELVI
MLQTANGLPNINNAQTVTSLKNSPKELPTYVSNINGNQNAYNFLNNNVMSNNVPYSNGLPVASNNLQNSNMMAVNRQQFVANPSNNGFGMPNNFATVASNANNLPINAINNNGGFMNRPFIASGNPEIYNSLSSNNLQYSTVDMPVNNWQYDFGNTNVPVNQNSLAEVATLSNMPNDCQPTLTSNNFNLAEELVKNLQIEGVDNMPFLNGLPVAGITETYATAYPYKDYVIAYIPIEELPFLASMQNLEAISYNNPGSYNTWYAPNEMDYNWSPYVRTTGPYMFGGQVRGTGAVSVAGRFGNDGYNQITSYSEPLTPIAVTPLPTLPVITKLPTVILPTTFNMPATNNMPSTLSVPETPMPFILATTTVPYSALESNTIESGLPLPTSVKFSGKVPASGRLISAQILPYGMPNRSIGNARIPNGMPSRGLPNGMANNAIRRSLPTIANNMGNGIFMNRQSYANAYYANHNLPNKANNNMAKSNLANIRPNIVEPTFSTPVMPEIKATAMENMANANLMANVGTTGLPKVANLNFGSNPIPVTVTSGNYGNLPVGLNILADNLEVRGTVAVTGRMPIYGAVTLNGSVPSDGKASVDYSCGGQQ